MHSITAEVAWMDRKVANDEAIQTLQHLGLTFSQARIYLALAESGESPVRTISKTSGVARAEIYRKMPILLKLGLAEKVLGIPIKFKATQDGLKILLKQENTEHLELQKKVTKLASNFKEDNKKMTQETENQFVMFPGKDAHIKWLKDHFEKNQTSRESIVTWKDHKNLHALCGKELQKAENRGVKCRTIIYIAENEKTVYENNKTFKNIPPNTLSRIVFTRPIVLGGVFDRKEVIIATTLNNPIQTSETVFWSNNPSFVALFQNYFETLWKKALEHKNEEN